MAKVHVMPGSRLPIPEWIEFDAHKSYDGGEGKVFFSLDNKYAIKLYHKPGSEKVDYLKAIIDHGKSLGDDEQFMAWPIAIVDKVDNTPALGLVIRKANNCSELYKLIFSPVDAFKQFQSGRSWLDYIKIARGTAAAVRAVHGKGIAHGDIQFRNFLADPVSDQVVMIDMDGMVVTGFLPPQVMGLSGFIAPEVIMGKDKPNKYTDLYSLAVLILWILLMRNVMQPQVCYDPDNPLRDDMIGFGPEACFSENPNDRRNFLPVIGVPLFRKGVLSYKALTPELQQLTQRALIDGLFKPTKRPSAREWELALANSYDVLFTCQNKDCKQAYFYPYWLTPPGRRKCPFCGSSVEAPMPVVLDLIQEKPKGHFETVRKMVLYNGLPIFEDVPEVDHYPPVTRKTLSRIGLTRLNTQTKLFHLFNECNEPWNIIEGGSGIVAKGQSIVLKPGVAIRFGPGKRICRVVE